MRTLTCCVRLLARDHGYVVTGHMVSFRTLTRSEHDGDPQCESMNRTLS